MTQCGPVTPIGILVANDCTQVYFLEPIAFPPHKAQRSPRMSVVGAEERKISVRFPAATLMGSAIPPEGLILFTRQTRSLYANAQSRNERLSNGRRWRILRDWNLTGLKIARCSGAAFRLGSRCLPDVGEQSGNNAVRGTAIPGVGKECEARIRALPAGAFHPQQHQ